MNTRIDNKELVERVSQATGHNPELVASILDAMLDEMYRAFTQGESITLRNFGSFFVRSGRETWTFKFNPGQKLRRLFGWSSTYTGEL